MLDEALLGIVASGRMGSLATIKRDGRAQLSVVSYAHFPEENLLRVSVTDTRAKTRNLRRDPRASLMIVSPDPYRFAVVESTASLSAVASSPDDEAVDELVATFRAIRGEHPDWDEFRQAMVADQRLVLRLPVERVYGKV